MSDPTGGSRLLIAQRKLSCWQTPTANILSCPLNCSNPTGLAPSRAAALSLSSATPYIDAADPHLGEGDLRFEPASALVAENQGLQDLYTIIAKAPEVLTPAAGWCWNTAGDRPRR